MKMRYDPSADAMYITLATPAERTHPSDAPVESEEVSPNVLLDFDHTGKLVGIEILYVSETVGANFEPLPAAAE